MNRDLWYNNSRFGSACRQAGAESGEERNPDERMLALAEKIAAAEGLFVWKGE